MAVISLLGILAFVVTSLVVGGRLIWISRKVHRLPALSMGLALFLTGGLGYILLFAAWTTSAANGSWLPWLQGSGLLCVSMGAASLWIFTWRTFRPGDAWATILVVAAGAMLLLSFGLLAAEGGFNQPVSLGPKFWLGFVTRGLSLVWAGAESLRYHSLMRRRQALGLAEPVVTNRFLLWGIAASLGAAATLASGVTIAMGPGVEGALVAVLRLATAVCGMGSAVAIWLAFLPPAAYARRFANAGTPLAEE